MPVIRPDEATTFDTHGSRFRSYVRPSAGSQQLCAWELTVPPGLSGVAHRPSREEVLLVLHGQVQITLDAVHSEVRTGDVILVAPGSELQVDGGPDGATVWVTTTPGLEAVTSDGVHLSPPWAH